MKTPHEIGSHVKGVILSTPRLDLKWMMVEDAPALQEICQSKHVAAMCGSLAHPYPEGKAEQFIREWAPKIEQGDAFVWGIFERSSGRLIGDTMLSVNKRFIAGEFGYIIAEWAWGNGYATETLAAVLEFGFETIGLRRISGICSVQNEASRRVMEKNGMLLEGTTKDSYLKWGVWEDEHHFGLTRPVYEQRKASRGGG
ncbi:MAG: GNAT family N-acetyltransferase [Phycisphaeraceae bacterium]|nr:GNAT family N-acetyltransferase [Phycisphaeraceae bacterium]